MSERELREAELEAWKRSGPPAYQVTSDVRAAHLAAFRAGVEFGRRTPGPRTENLVCYITAHRRAWPDAVSVQIPADLADGFVAEHEPAKPARSIRGDSRTDDAGRWQDLESGVET